MKLKKIIFALVAMLSSFAFTANAQVAKVGNTEYATIDEAIAAWGNGTTLTLMADVTLSDVIKLSSTEHHILDLGTYTMTAGVKKNSLFGYTYETKLDAIEIVNNGRSSASYALDIKADATNPGGINASGKAVVKTTGKSGVQDRPIIRFYGGVFNGSNVVSHSGSNGTNCPQFWFYGGEFNGTISANRAKFLFYGGTFNGTLSISVDSSADALVCGGKFKKLSNSYGSSLNTDKFTIGSAAGVYDRGIYVDAEGYYVITSAPITEVSAKYPAVKKESYNSNNYFYYSAANTYGMFYEVASMAGTGDNVTVWEPVKAPAVEEIVKPEATEEEKAVVEEVIAEVTNNAAVKNNTVELPAEVVNFSIELAAVEVAEETTPEAPEAPVTVVTEISYTVTPSNAAGEKVSKPSEPITFRLPLPSNWASEKVKVIYNGTALDGDYEVKTVDGAKYVEVESQSFSTYTVKAVATVAKIGETPYATLADAVEAAQAGETITMIADVELTALVEIPEGKEFTLDLNGKTVNSVFNGNSTTNHIYALSNKGTLTIQDSKGNGSINSRGIHNYGSLTLNAGAINAIDGNGGYAVNNQNGSTFVMNGGVVAATYEDDHQSSSGGYDATALKVPAGCTATLNGGTINNVCDFTFAIDAAGTLEIPATSTITVNGTHGAISVSGGTTTIDAGTFQIPADEYSRTDNVLYVAGGSLVVNGGTFIGDSDTASGGSCLYDAAGKAVVNGGTFKGSSGGDVWGTTGTTIKGGTFENLIEKQHIAPGYELNADGTVAMVSVAEVNGTKYASLAEAVAAAQNNETITLVSNIELAEVVTIPADKTLTIDLNGKAISMEESIIATAYAINNLGNLTITDGVGGGSINARGMYNGYGNGGANVASAKITVVNGTFNAKGTNGGAAIFNYGIADIQGGNFTSIGGYSLNNQAGASMTIADGVTANNGIYASNATLVVDGGEINGNRSGCHVLYAWNSAVTINGGTFYNYNSGNSTIMSAGTSVVTINGGTISIKDGRVPGNGNTWTSCLTDAANTAKIIVNGGTFNGGVRVQGGATMTINAGSFNDVAGSGYNVYTGAIVEVKGGTFTDATAQTFAKNNLADGYEMGTDGAVAKKSIAAIGENKYESLEAAAAAAQSGDEIVMLADVTLAEALTLPAGITFNGNDKQITGIIVAAGDITFAGVTKAGDLDFAVGNTVVNIPAGASLQLNGSARMSIGFGTTFNIVGTIEDAKTADKATVVPSLVIPGASFSGAGVKFNVTNAYISVPSSYCSTSKSASGTFDFNITNSIWESAGKLAFEEQSVNAKVDFALVNSVLTTGSHLVFGTASGDEGVVIDNSYVNKDTSRQLENCGTMTVKNGSVVNGAVATSSNAKNPGTVIVENATYAVTGEFSGSDLGTGTLVIKNGANVSIGSITKANIVVDATDMTAGELANFTANLANFAGELSVINNDKLEAKIENGKIVLAAKPVAKIGEKAYATLDEAVAAVKEGETITILAGTISEGSIKLPAALKNVTIKGEEGAILKDMTITAADGNTVNYEGLTFDGITFDNSNVVLTGWRTGDVVYKNIKVNGCTFKNIVRTNNEAAFHINCDAAEAVNGFTFTNNVVDGVSGASNSAIYAQVTGEVVVSDNVINNVAFRPYVIQVTTNDGVADTFTVTGNTFSGSAAGRAQGLGSDAAGTDAVELVVSNNIFKDITNAQQICYWNFNAETTTADLSGNYYDIDILANPSRIYFNSAAADTNDLVAMGIFPIYTELNEDGTINENSAYYPPVVKMGGNGYQSVEEALAAAKAEGLTEVEITIVGKNTASTADSFDLVYTTLFDNVTIKQENGGVAYYINELYTGSRTNAGQFVFDGVNIVVTGQYMFEGNVKLSNNSLIKSVAEANCFVYYAEVTVEAGSKIDGVIEDIRGGSLIIDGGKTDGTYCETPGLRDAILAVNWTDSKLVLKNGAYVKVNAADEVGRLTVNGTMDVSDSKLESYQYIAVNSGATLNLNAGSVITTKELTGAGTINVDATELNAESVTVIAGNLTGFTGTINVEGEGIITERTENGLVIKADPNYIAELEIVDGVYGDYTFEEDMTVGKLTYVRTLPAAGIWYPVFLPFEISVASLADNFDVARINDLHTNFSEEDGSIEKMWVEYIVRKSGTLAAGKPFLVRAKSSDVLDMVIELENVTLKASSEKSSIAVSSAITKVTFEGVYEATSGLVSTPSTRYMAVNANGVWDEFDGYPLNPFRVMMTLEILDEEYYVASTASFSVGARVIGEENEDGTTTIYDVEADREENDMIFDLQGRRVLETEKGGIYIKNGKKFIVK